MADNDHFNKLVRCVFEQLGTILVKYLPIPTILNLLETQLFIKLNTDLTNRARLAIYCDPHHIESRVDLYTNVIQNSHDNITPIHDLKIWNIHIKHKLSTDIACDHDTDNEQQNTSDKNMDNIPSIHELMDIQQLLSFVIF